MDLVSGPFTKLSTRPNRYLRPDMRYPVKYSTRYLISGWIFRQDIRIRPDIDFRIRPLLDILYLTYRQGRISRDQISSQFHIRSIPNYYKKLQHHLIILWCHSAGFRHITVLEKDQEWVKIHIIKYPIYSFIWFDDKLILLLDYNVYYVC